MDFTGDATPPKPSTGHHYKGNIPYAYWVGAKDIEIGHRLIDDKGNYQTVIAIHTEQIPLDSYNLEVDNDHTFFIKGIDGQDAVWVHNDCYRGLPNNAILEPDGSYAIMKNGEKVPLIEAKIGDQTVFYTKDHKEGDPYRNKANQAVDEKGGYVVDPTAKVHQPKPQPDDYNGQGRPTPQQSEQDVGKTLPIGAREQVSFKDGKEVDYGTPDSVRPDWCIGNTCSIEVKNYDIHDNRNGLINIIAEQAIERAKHLPKGMVQRVVIDLRGQGYKQIDLDDISDKIMKKSNGTIKLENIEFLR